MRWSVGNILQGVNREWRNKLVETYWCLYCDAKFEGDKEWVEHLKSQKHGVYAHAHGFARGVSDALNSFTRKSEPFIDIPPPNAGETWNE